MVNPESTEDTPKRKDLNDTLFCLIASETIEILIPLVILITYATAYYGPNANILLTIGNDYWDYGKIDNIMDFAGPLFKMLFIDVGIAAISGVILWASCNINYIQEFSRVVKKYWLWMGLKFAMNLGKVK